MFSLARPLYLTTRQPSPTTASYTVSTSPPLDTLPSQLLFCLNLLTRLLCGLCTGILVALKLRRDAVPYLDAWPFLAQLTQQTSWRVLLPVALVAGWIVVRRGYTEESLLVLRSLGIQTTTSSATYLTSGTSRFIPTEQVQDIFIHEAFLGFEVRFYLAVVVKGEGEAVVVFPKLLPKRAVLEQVWRGAKACLYEPKG